MGLAEMEQMERRYSPRKPRELARILWPAPESKDPPRLLVMRGSAAKHAASTRRASAMRSAAGRSLTSFEKMRNSPVSLPKVAGLGSPTKGSSEVTRESATAPWMRRSRPGGVRSLVEVDAARAPRKTRKPAAREPESFKR